MSSWISAALPAPLQSSDPTPGPAAARCGSAGRPPAPAPADMRTVLWTVGRGARAGRWGCSRGEGTTSRRGFKPVYIIYILETHKILVPLMKDTGCWDSLDKERDGPWNKLRYRSKTFDIEVTSSMSKYLRYLRYRVKKLWYRRVWTWDSISKFCFRYRSFWKIFDIAYTTSISKLVKFDIIVLWYRVLYSILVHFDIKVLNFDIEVLRYRSASISKCFDIGYDIQ